METHGRGQTVSYDCCQSTSPVNSTRVEADADVSTLAANSRHTSTSTDLSTFLRLFPAVVVDENVYGAQ